MARQERQIAERLRVKELLRYFEPAQLSPGGTEEQKPRIATDISLTALAQLAALRLDCERCFISLIDNSKQYIIAEATRTIGLVSENTYDHDNDKLSFGQTVLDFQTGVCPGTIACFTSTDDSLDVSTAYIKASRSYYVMNDMSQLEGYKARPYVSGWPHMRYYAEVPIHSPLGQTIGTLCVVDNKGREGLDTKGLATLKEISNAVMDHLELCSSKVQRNRAESMIQALGQFVEGHDSVREPWITEEASRLSEPGLRHLSIQERAEMSFGSTTRAPQNAILNSQGSHEVKNRTSSQSSIAPSKLGSNQLSARSSSTIGSTTPDTTLASTPDGNSLQSPINMNNSGEGADYSSVVASTTLDPLEDTLFRAANLLREAMKLDAVVFYDPRLSNDPLLAEVNSTSDSVRSQIASSIDHQPKLDYTQPDPISPFSRIISYSMRDEHDFEGIQMPELTLQALLKCFPKGGLLSFDKEGIISAAPFTSYLSVLEAMQDGVTMFGPTCSDSVTAQFSETDANELRRIFPNITSLITYPLWDTSGDKSVAHCVGWSSDSTRILRQQDITYTASFMNSITAQLSQLEVVAADQAKTAFISSISHELRSPLHGIMASIEMLRDLTLDPSCHDVLTLIETCGSTLLDTIDDVLVFSRINRRENKQDSKMQENPQIDDGVSPVSAVDIAGLIEETSSICLVGHPAPESMDNLNTSPKLEQFKYDINPSSSSTSPILICDIMPGCGWIFETNGAIWKRILMNVLGNSMKYTSSGYIIVKLRQNLLPVDSVGTTPTWMNVTLSITDSGKGMSQDYLAHHLFKPFCQENSMAPGTGLGLSIVSRLVQSIGGTIDVTSEEGVGTAVEIAASLKYIENDAWKPSMDAKLLSTLKMGFFDLNAAPDLGNPPTGILSPASQAVLALRSTVTSYATNCGLHTVTASSIDSDSIDLLVIEDFRYQLLPSHQIEALRKPVIVLCTNFVQAHNRRIKKPDSVVLFASPFGPQKFKQCIETCLVIRQQIIASKVSPGALVLVSRPTYNPPSYFQAAATIEPELSEQANVDNHNTASILLVEDNPINLNLLIACVSKMGFDFKTSTDGAQAFDTYKSSTVRVNLIFMDIQMPIMDGMEATRRIRKHEKEHSLPPSTIVALTALGSNDAKQAATDCGVDIFLTKPVSLKTLKGIIAQYCTCLA